MEKLFQQSESMTMAPEPLTPIPVLRIKMPQDHNTQFITNTARCTACPTERIMAFCKEKDITCDAFFCAVWSILLHNLSGEDVLVFFYQNELRCTHVAFSDSLDELLVIAEKSANTSKTILKGTHGQDGSLLIVNLDQKTFPDASGDTNNISQLSVRKIDNVSCIVSISLSETVEICLSISEKLAEQGMVNLISQQFSKLIMEITDPFRNCKETSSLLKDVASITNFRPSSWDSITILDKFAEAAEAYPELVAIDLFDEEFSSELVTYAEFDTISNQVARKFRERNCGTESRIFFALRKCIQLYTGILAAWKIGAIVVPIDPFEAPEKFKRMYHHLKPQIVLMDESSENGDLVNPSLIMMVDLETSRHYPWSIETRSVKSQEVPDLIPISISSLDWNRCAYIVHTSGSTGPPKAVAISHKNASHAIISAHLKLKLKPGTRMLQKVPVVFDMFMFDVLLAFWNGLTLVSSGKSNLLQNLDIVVQKKRIEYMTSTTSLLRLLDPGNCSDLRTIFCIGEPLTAKIVERWHGTVYNAYGPSEAAMAISLRKVEVEDIPYNIGFPFMSGSIAIVNEFNTPVPAGSVGEIMLGGEQIYMGYVTGVSEYPQPSTGSLITTLPKLIHVPGFGYFYPSGDLGRLLHDGSINFLGRKDDQVKVHGARIELGEIDSAIQSLNDLVNSAVTLLWKRDRNVECLISFIVPNNLEADLNAILSIDCGFETYEGVGSNSLKAKIHEQLTKRLSRNMIPSYFFLINKIPIGRTGKADRSRLLEFAKAGSRGRVLVETENTQRTKFCNLLKSIFNDISCDKEAVFNEETPLFVLGIDSVSTIQISAILYERYGISLTPYEIKKAHNVCDLIDLLDSSNSNSQKNKSFSGKIEGIFRKALISVDVDKIIGDAGLDTSKISCILPCSNMQSSLLNAFEISDKKNYMNSRSIFLGRCIDENVLQYAYSRLIETTSILRLTFHRTGRPSCPFIQVIHKADKNMLYPKVLRSMEIVDETLLSSLVSEFSWTIKKSFGIAVTNEEHCIWSDQINIGSSFHQILFIQDPRGIHFTLIGIHAAFDDWSWNQIFNDFQCLVTDPKYSIYDDKSDFIRVFESVLKREVELTKFEMRTYWNNRIREMSKFPCIKSIRETERKFIRSKSRSEVSKSSVYDLCQKTETSASIVGQICLVKLLKEYLGQGKDITYGVVLSGRSSIPNTQKLKAPLLSTLPISIESSETNYKQLVECLKAQNNMLLELEHTPLSFVKRQLQEKNLKALFDVLFAYQLIVDENHSSLAPENILSVSSIEFYFKGDCAMFEVNTDTCVMDQIQCDLVAQQLSAILKTICHKEIHDLSDINRELERSHRNLLSIHEAPIREFDADFKLINEGFTQIASKQPDQVAIDFIDRFEEVGYLKRTIVTYAELDTLTNKMARLIYEKVGNNGIVAHHFDKCVEAFVCSLAILKSGNGLLCLDIESPLRRKRNIIKQANVKLIVTNERGMKLWPSKAELTEDKIERLAMNDLRQENLVEDDVDSLNIASFLTYEYFQLMEKTLDGNALNLSQSPGDVGYVLFTSGSTGDPKGCVISHESLVQTLLSFMDQLEGTFEDGEVRTLAFASWHFDVSIFEQYWTLLVGGRICSCPKEVLLHDLEQALRTFRITHLDLTPSLGCLLEPESTGHLRVLITGGEKMREDMLEKWDGTEKLYNFWGPSELTIGASVLRKVKSNSLTSNIGKPFRNCDLIIYDYISEVPILKGGIGDITMGGKQVADGYLNKPELTSESFTLNKYFGKVFHTRDLGRYIEFDGTISFEGRIDDQIKLRGQRIELGEINSVIQRASNSIESVITFISKTSRNSEKLVSFVQVKQQNTSSNIFKAGENMIVLPRKDVKEYCTIYLAPYMIPFVVLEVSKMPLNTSNKIDKKILDAYFQKYHQKSLSDPHTNVSIHNYFKEPMKVDPELSRALSEILDLNESDLQKSLTLMEIGIDSISVFTLRSQLLKRGFQVASLASIMENPTMESLLDSSPALAEVEQVKEVATKTSTNTNSKCIITCKSQLIGAADIIPCTSSIAGMIIEELRNPGSYTLKLQVKSFIPFRKSEIVNAWRILATKNDILRSLFCQSKEGYEIAVFDQFDTAFKVIFQKELITEADKPAQWIQLESGTHQFSAFGSLFPRIIWPENVEMNSFSDSFTLSIFHGYSDGWSIPLIFQDLSKILQGYIGSDRIQFSYMARTITGTESKSHSFWKKVLTHRNLNFAPMFPKCYSSNLESERVTDLVSACKHKFKAEISTILLTSFIRALHESSFDFARLVGITDNGRMINVDYSESVIGSCVNIIPFPLEYSVSDGKGGTKLLNLGSLSAAELLCTVQFIIGRLRKHSQYSMHSIRKMFKLRPEEHLFDVVFTSNQLSEGHGIFNVKELDGNAKFPLVLEALFEDDGAGINALIHFCEEGTRFSATNMLRLIKTELAAISGADLSDFHVSEQLKVYFEALEKFDGNVNVKRMPKRGPESNSALEDSYQDTSSRSVVKQLIAEILDESTDTIQDDSELFYYGFDSVDAAKLAFSLRKKRIKTLPIDVILQNPTVSAISSLIRKDLEAEHKRENIDLKKDSLDQKSDFPLTSLQISLIEQTLMDKNFYIGQSIFQLARNIDLNVLLQSWKQVLMSHEILRATFPIKDYEVANGWPPVNRGHIISSKPKSKFELLETTYSDGEDILVKVQAFAERFKMNLQKEFSPDHNTPLSFVLLEFRHHSQSHDAIRKFAIVTMHHALYDGLSLSGIYSDLQRAYHGQALTQKRFKPFVDYLYKHQLKEGLNHWRSFMEPIQSCLVCTRRSSGPITKDSRIQDYEIGNLISLKELQEACGNLKITFDCFSKLCWSSTLCKYLEMDTVCFLIVNSLRHLIEEGEELSGPCLNTIPFKVKLGGVNIYQLSQVIMKATFECSRYSFTPLHLIADELKVRISDLADTLLNVENENDECNSIWHLVEEQIALEYPVSIRFILGKDGLKAKLSIMEGHMSSAEIDTLRKTFKETVASIVNTAKITGLEDNPLLRKPSKQRMIRYKNITISPHELEAEIVSKFGFLLDARIVLLEDETNGVRLAVFLALKDGFSAKSVGKYIHILDIKSDWESIKRYIRCSRWPLRLVSYVFIAIKETLNCKELLRRSIEEATTIVDSDHLKENFKILSGELECTVQESCIIKAAASVLEIDHKELTPYTDLFAVGLDSIMAIKFRRKLQTLGIRVTIKDIISSPTAEALALTVSNDSNHENAKVGRAKLQRIGDAISEQLSIIRRFKALRESVLESQKYKKEDIEVVLPLLPFQLLSLYQWHESNGRLFEAIFTLEGSSEWATGAFVEQWKKIYMQSSLLRAHFESLSGPDGAKIVQVILKREPIIIFERPETESLFKEAVKRESKERALSPEEPVHVTISIYEDSAKVLIRLLHSLYDAVSIQDLFSALRNEGRPLGADLMMLTNTVSDVESKSALSASAWEHRIQHFKDLPPLIDDKGMPSDEGQAESHLSASASSIVSRSNGEWTMSSFPLAGHPTVTSLRQAIALRGLKETDVVISFVMRALGLLLQSESIVIAVWLAHSIDTEYDECRLIPLVNIVPLYATSIRSKTVWTLACDVQEYFSSMDYTSRQISAEALGAVLPQVFDVSLNVLPMRTDTRDRESRFRTSQDPTTAIEAFSFARRASNRDFIFPDAVRRCRTKLSIDITLTESCYDITVLGRSPLGNTGVISSFLGFLHEEIRQTCSMSNHD